MLLKCDATEACRSGNKVAAIKLVRAATSMGLKESKDLVDAGIFKMVARMPCDDLIRDLRSVGVLVNEHGGAPETTLSMLEDALHEAVSLQAMEIAEDILALLKKWRK